MNDREIRLGTRNSALARWQAEWVAARLTEAGHRVELVPIATSGDVKGAPIREFGGQGVFTKEIQLALQREEVDLAVHSLKDLPTEPTEGLTLAATPQRENPADALICPVASSIVELPKNARVGTGSLRRVAQLLHARPDLVVSGIRGNVETRLRKLDEGQFDAIVLACAGLSRLGLEDRIAGAIPLEAMLPAVGQGALGLEIRAADQRMLTALAPLNHPHSHAAVLAERSLLRSLRAGCLAPVGAWGRVENDRLVLDAAVLSSDGERRLAAHASGSLDEAIALGKQVAEALVEQGAAELIAVSRASQ
jgi:hydroxymethylbilane synthase